MFCFLGGNANFDEVNRDCLEIRLESVEHLPLWTLALFVLVQATQASHGKAAQI